MKRTLLVVVVALVAGALFAQHPDANQQIEDFHEKETRKNQMHCKAP